MPRSLKAATTVVDNLPFEDLYDLVDGSDFLVCNIEAPYEEEFATVRTTGIRQLSLGFLRPCIIQREHAEYYGFSERNAVIYERGELAQALLRATDMPAAEYDAMCRELDALRQEVEHRSLANLERAIVGKELL